MSDASQPAEFSYSRRKKKKGGFGPIIVLAVLIAAVGGGAAYWFVFMKSLELAPFPLRQAMEMAKLEFKVEPIAKGLSPDQLMYSLEDAPAGAAIDSKTGVLSWTPSEEQGPAKYTMKVHVAATERPDVAATQSLTINVQEANQPPVLDKIEDQLLKGKGTLTLTISGRDADIPAQQLKYGLLKGGAPPGSKIDEKTGEFTWAPKSVKANTDYVVTVLITDASGGQAKQSFKVRQNVDPSVLELFTEYLRNEGVQADMIGREPKPTFTGTSRVFDLAGQRIRTYEYGSTELAMADPGLLAAKMAPNAAATHVFHRAELVALYDGTDPKILGYLQSQFGNAVNKVTVAKSMPAPMPDLPTTTVTPSVKPSDEVAQAVADLYEKKKLLLPKEYVTLRKIFATAFEKEHDLEIRSGFGADYDDVQAWFAKHVDIKEELYTAIDPKHDKITEVLALFNELRKKFPKQFANYGNLAIATSVVWDNEKNVYEYSNHQRRTHSNMPAGLVGAMENFQYMLDAERVMEGRGQYIPWEFLVHVVNDRTPIVERQWALQNYLPNRSMFGACYSQVPYDTEMLKTSSRVCKLDGKDYSLPNIRQFGGVCAMQADFAARVGKSLGVPAEYVTGESNSLDLHAWVMWVELKQVTANSIVFSLESHGRYNYDQYYVGKLRNPQTGESTTDRELELSLQNVGANPIARRHAALVMKAYPQLRELAKLDVTHELLFVSDVIKLSPGNEAAWAALAKMSKDGLIDKAHQKQLVTALDNLFRTFTKFPDFTWTVFDDLIAFQPDVKQRIALYQRLVELYELGKRPDLACEARLKLSDILVAEKKQLDAVEGLAYTIKKFPSEGRYVPKMLDKLEEIASGLGNTSNPLVLFYQSFLPLVPKTRGNEPSAYAMKMYERAAERFRENNQPQLAQAAEAELAKLKAAAASN